MKRRSFLSLIAAAVAAPFVPTPVPELAPPPLKDFSGTVQFTYDDIMRSKYSFWRSQPGPLETRALEADQLADLFTRCKR